MSSRNEQTAPAANLPNEILCEIFAYLDLRDRLAARAACKRWNGAMRHWDEFLHRNPIVPLGTYDEIINHAGFDVQGLAVFITEMPRYTLPDLQVRVEDEQFEFQMEYTQEDHDYTHDTVMELLCLQGEERVFRSVRTMPRDSPNSLRYGYCSIAWRNFILYHGSCEVFRVDRGEEIEVKCQGKLTCGGKEVKPSRTASNLEVLAVAAGTLSAALHVYGESEDKSRLVCLRKFELDTSHWFWTLPLSTDVFSSSEADKHLAFWAISADAKVAVVAIPDNRLRFVNMAIKACDKDYAGSADLETHGCRTHETDLQMENGSFVHETASYTVFPALGQLGEVTMMISCGSIFFAVLNPLDMTLIRCYRPTGPQLPGTTYLPYRLTLSQIHVTGKGFQILAMQRPKISVGMVKVLMEYNVYAGSKSPLKMYTLPGPHKVEEFQSCHMIGGDESVICLGRDSDGVGYISDSYLEQCNHAVTGRNITELNLNCGDKNVVIMRKLVNSFQPVNTGELLYQIFDGRSVTLRAGSDLYVSFTTSRGNLSVFRLNSGPLKE